VLTLVLTYFLSEPDVEDTISILRGLKERYEVYHGVRIQDRALVAAADAWSTKSIALSGKNLSVIYLSESSAAATNARS
jgi:ATP-dependent Clp protease ATP-binding subunit ClpA